MEKTINIGEKKITLKSNAATPLIYKSQFHTDYFGDLMGFAKTFENIQSGQEEIDLNDSVMQMTDSQIRNFSTDVIYQMVWALAKTADKTIPGDLIEWLSDYDDFNIFEIFEEVSDLINEGIATKKV